MCPNVTSLPIQDSYLEEDFQYVKFRITGCSERVDCAAAEDYNQKNLTIFTLNSHVNFEKEEPLNKSDFIDYSLDSTNFFSLDPHINQKMNLYFMESDIYPQSKYAQAELFYNMYRQYIWGEKEKPGKLKTFEFKQRYQYT